jgi:hypothetical protein
MKIITMRKIPDIVDFGDEVIVAPNKYSFVLADNAENQYEVITDRETYETLVAISKIIAENASIVEEG